MNIYKARICAGVGAYHKGLRYGLLTTPGRFQVSEHVEPSRLTPAGAVDDLAGRLGWETPRSNAFCFSISALSWRR